MTTTELIEKATAKGYKVSSEIEGYIGIMLRKNATQCHWFKIYSANEVIFNHTYSMNTGKSFKGVRHGLEIYWKIVK